MRQAKTLEIFSGVQDVKFINLRLALHMAIIKLDVDKVNLKMVSITHNTTLFFCLIYIVMRCFNI